MEAVSEEIVMELRSTVKSREWNRVVAIFKEHAEIHATRINKWSDTALHAAIETSSEDDVVLVMVNAIINMSQDRHNAIKILSLENDAGNTPLHCAASRGSRFICNDIIRFAIEPLIGMRNKKGETPLFLAALHGHLVAFYILLEAAGEDSSLYWRRNNGDTILHCTIEREFFDLSCMIFYFCEGISSLINEKGESPLAVLASTPTTFISSIHFSWWDRLLLLYGSKGFVVPVKIKRTLLGLTLMTGLVSGDSWYDAWIDTNVRDTRSVLDEDQETFARRASVTPEAVRVPWHSGWNERWPSALLAATKHGAAAMVKEILRQKPFAIDEETSDKKNIVLVAIEARQSDILEILIKHSSWSEQRLKYAKDSNGDTALHLAAKRSVNPGISLSVIHLQWEVHWFEYVNEHMPDYFMTEVNNKGQTPWMVFEAEHRGMLEESDRWVKEMSGNYMVATTLISSVTFATCFQIPGGYDSQHGTPIVGSNTVFQLFAITALVSFCFSITSLAAFLAIYSSRNDQYRHYRRALPLKLLAGFFSLFVSIVSMLISFCAAHVFELNPQHKSRSIPLYLSLTSVPLCFYSATQIPLYRDLLFCILAPVPFSRAFYVGQQKQQKKKEEKMKRNEHNKSNKKRDIFDDIVRKIEAGDYVTWI